MSNDPALKTSANRPDNEDIIRPRIAFYGGSFDPVHSGHLAIAKALIGQFQLDEFVFIPAFHAPHKKRNKPTSAYDRYAMLCLVTQHEPQMSVSKMEIEVPERPYSVKTLTHLSSALSDADIFFVMGADSWEDITTWREWETVLTLTNHIVVTRPGSEIHFDHVTDEIRGRIVDLRDGRSKLEQTVSARDTSRALKIYFTDAVDIDISATTIRQKIRDEDRSWHKDVPVEVANYIEKYQIYS